MSNILYIRSNLQSRVGKNHYIHIITRRRHFVQESFIGIDVSKDKLDVYILPEKKYFTTTNDKKGFRKLVSCLSQRNIRLICLEATGGYELACAYNLVENNLPIAIINPKRIRSFTRAKDIHCKTDKIDAQIIAEFAVVMKPNDRELLSKDLREIKELLYRRTQLVNEIKAEKCRCETVISETVLKNTKEHLKLLASYVKNLEKEIKERISSNSDYRFLYDFYMSFKGIGEITAANLIANLPELGTLNRNEIAALLGAAPYNADSGKKTGKRFIRGGRKNLRDVFYMATLSACFNNSLIRDFYQRLVNSGKNKKVAITACMRKFITILNAKLKELLVFEHLFKICS